MLKIQFQLHTLRKHSWLLDGTKLTVTSTNLRPHDETNNRDSGPTLHMHFRVIPCNAGYLVYCFRAVNLLDHPLLWNTPLTHYACLLELSYYLFAVLSHARLLACLSWAAACVLCFPALWQVRLHVLFASSSHGVKLFLSLMS